MHLFYAPEISVDTLEYLLTEEESKHCIRVLRMKQGDEITLLNGRGLASCAVILEDHPKRCKLQITSSIQHKRPEQELHIALAPTKNMDRIEWFLEKATEIGLSQLTFLKCEHNERGQLKLDRLEKIAVSAMKQSKRFYLPILDELIPFAEFVKNHPNGYIGHCYESQKKPLSDLTSRQVFLIGPEGDFSEAEVKLAHELGYQAVSLSDFRLRTETAALMAVMKLSII